MATDEQHRDVRNSAIIAVVVLIGLVGASLICGCSQPALDGRRINHNCAVVRQADGALAFIAPHGRVIMRGSDDDWRVLRDAINDLLEPTQVLPAPGEHSLLVEMEGE